MVVITRRRSNSSINRWRCTLRPRWSACVPPPSVGKAAGAAPARARGATFGSGPRPAAEPVVQLGGQLLQVGWTSVLGGARTEANSMIFSHFARSANRSVSGGARTEANTTIFPPSREARKLFVGVFSAPPDELWCNSKVDLSKGGSPGATVHGLRAKNSGATVTVPRVSRGGANWDPPPSGLSSPWYGGLLRGTMRAF